MADDLQDGSEVVDFHEDSLTKDGLVNKRKQNCIQIWKYFVFILTIKKTDAQRSNQSIVNMNLINNM